MHDRIVCLNDPVNWVDPWGLWGVDVGGSLMGIDFSTTIYDSDKGFFQSTETNLGVSTTIVGGGMKITFDTPVVSRTAPNKDVNVSIGFLSKYTAVTYNTELSRGSVNLGIGLGSPITFGTSIQNFVEGLSNRLENIGNSITNNNSPCTK